MKKMLILLIVILLTGCTIENIDNNEMSLEERKIKYNDAISYIEAVKGKVDNYESLVVSESDKLFLYPTNCIKNDNNYEYAYVGILYNKDDYYQYYWISKDKNNCGVDKLTNEDELNKNSFTCEIISNKPTENDVFIKGRTTVIISDVYKIDGCSYGPIM